MLFYCAAVHSHVLLSKCLFGLRGCVDGISFGGAVDKIEGVIYILLLASLISYRGFHAHNEKFYISPWFHFSQEVVSSKKIVIRDYVILRTSVFLGVAIRTTGYH